MPYFIPANSGLRRIEAALAQKPGVNDAPKKREAYPLREAIEFDAGGLWIHGRSAHLRNLSLQIPLLWPTLSVRWIEWFGKISTVLNLVLLFFYVRRRRDPLGWDGPPRGCRRLLLRAADGCCFPGQRGLSSKHSRQRRHSAPLCDRRGGCDRQLVTLNCSISSTVCRMASTPKWVNVPSPFRAANGYVWWLFGARSSRNPSGADFGPKRQALSILGTETLINETMPTHWPDPHGDLRDLSSVSLMKSDIIFVMVNGFFAEFGSHELLAANRGAFIPNLWAKQSGFTVSAKGDWATVDFANRLLVFRF